MSFALRVAQMMLGRVEANKMIMTNERGTIMQALNLIYLVELL